TIACGGCPILKPAIIRQGLALFQEATPCRTRIEKGGFRQIDVNSSNLDRATGSAGEGSDNFLKPTPSRCRRIYRKPVRSGENSGRRYADQLILKLFDFA